MLLFRCSFLFVLFAGNTSCNHFQNKIIISNDTLPTIKTGITRQHGNDSARTIHIFVALCDNKFQGIVPVPAGIGNGQDPKHNLYWGAGYGVKSFFGKKQSEWIFISSQLNPLPYILERVLYKHVSKNIFILADAYDGKYIKDATISFLEAASGKNEILLKEDNNELHFGGSSDLLAYTGHDGLMDFSLQQKFENTNKRKREAIILACYSKNYFLPHLRNTGAFPLVWTSGLLSPEAYTLYDAIHIWINNGLPGEVRLAAAKAYAKYQKCGLNAAKNLMIQGW